MNSATALEERPAAAGQTAVQSAWVVISNAHEAWGIAQSVQSAGWQLRGVANGMKGVRDLMRSCGEWPDVVVCGLRFDDGDGFQLIRALANGPRTPAVFIASRQQRSVIKAAVALAAACGVQLAGVAEQPVDPAAVGGALRAHSPRQAPPPRPAQPPLSREELMTLFDRGALVPWLQPKVRIDTREVVGFEALMRAHDDQGRLIMPDRLVSALAHHGLLDQSINVAMQSLANVAFCQELGRAAEAIDLDPSWITIEITETDAMTDLAQVIENTARIRMLGFNLAIDDFGTAYSSFFQLSQIPFSELKIERAFTKRLQEDAARQAIVRACAQLGASLGLHVVAEGVETAAELACVQDCGCSQVQGYLVARPMPSSQAFEWLRGLPDLRVDWPALP
jgi:EAL domain-containing protein (putative c-di-GMP-specific phosphodiesterase class I)